MSLADVIIGPELHNEFRAWTASRPDHDHYIGMLNPPRPGVLGFITVLEYYYFPPGTAMNDVLFSHCVECADVLFVVVSIPHSFNYIAKRIAPDFGIELADGHIPRVMMGDQIVRFPIDARYVWSLQSRPGHSVYGSSGTWQRQAAAREHAFAVSIQNGSRPDIASFQELIFG